MAFPSVFFHLFLFALAAKYVVAISLYIPGIDYQPLSVAELGAGNDGRTTWEVVAGQPSGTLTEPDHPFAVTGTLVEGSSDAVFAYTVPYAGRYISYSCTIDSNRIANCDQFVVAPSATSTATGIIEPAVPFVVQGDTTTFPPSNASPTSSQSTSTTTSSKTPSATGGSNASSNTSGAKRAGYNVAVSMIAGLLGFALA